MGDFSIRIERATNGYEITVRDPKIVKANNKRDNSSSKGPYVPYRDPTREYVFTDLKQVLAWLGKHADKALPADEYDSSFDAAIQEEE